MSVQWKEINGACLRYEHRVGSGRTLVLIHQMGAAIETWDAVVPELSKRWSLLRYDQRGSGLSEKVRGTLSVDQHADDLAALIDSLGIEGPVAVVGSALGAAVAVRFAVRFPQRTAVLFVTSPATDVEPERRSWMLDRADQLERHGTRAIVGAGEQGNRHEILRLVSDPASLAASWRMLADLDLDESLAAISCPTLVVAGERDKVRYPARVAEVARKIPGASLVTLDTGHVMAVDTPELMVATLSRFLTEHRY